MQCELETVTAMLDSRDEAVNHEEDAAGMFDTSGAFLSLGANEFWNLFLYLFF